MNLFQASRQWAERPADERFTSLQEMHDTCKGYANSAVEARLPSSELRVEAVQTDIQLVGRTGHPARFTHWGFGQLCARVGCPASYLSRLPATLAAQNLNHGLKQYSSRMDVQKTGSSGYDTEDANLLFHRCNGSDDMVLRAFTSQWYARIWNDQVVEKLMQLPQGWRVPPARPAFPGQPGTRLATQADVLEDHEAFGGLSVNLGDPIAPAGLYASDRDMFAFLVNESLSIRDGSKLGLARGVFVENSEVGASAFKVTTFLYRHVCGNHIVWGAESLAKTAVVHVGDKAHGKAFKQLQATIAEYAESSGRDDEAKVTRTQTYLLGDGKDDVVDKLFKLHLVTRKNAEAAYASTDSLGGEDGDPRTPWGIANGLTRLSQAAKYADERTELDRAAGRLLQIAF